MWWFSFFNISTCFNWFSNASVQQLQQKEFLNQTSLNVSLIAQYKKGDIVDKFTLDSKLEILGLRQLHIKDDNWRLATSKDNSNKFVSLFDELVVSSMENSNSDVVLLDDFNIHYNRDCVRNGSFCLNENIFHGGHGEIWRAFKVLGENIKVDESTKSGVNRSVSYILKRMHVKDRSDILQCALREITFGELLVKQNNLQLMFARYISFFISQNKEDYWLVYKDEGISLQQTMYATVYSDQSALLKPSQLWRNMRTTTSGEKTLKGILHQLLTDVAKLHSLGITHRDLKPSNILLNVEDRQNPRILIADFSSAVQVNLDQLYTASGPSIAEETLFYAPPEVLLSINSSQCRQSTQKTPCTPVGIPFDPERPTSYDLWSVGVIYLELLLGTADVFALDDRSVNIITQRLHKKGIKDPDVISQAILLAGLSEYCIYDPQEEVTTVISEDRTEATINGSSGAVVPVGEELCSNELDATNQSLVVSPSTFLQSPKLLAIDYPTPKRKAQPTCGLSQLSKAILKRDQLGKGFNSLWGLDLLSRLLQFDPQDRINAGDALQHAYFTGSYICSIDNSEHATQEDLDAYERDLLDQGDDFVRYWENNLMSAEHEEGDTEEWDDDDDRSMNHPIYLDPFNAVIVEDTQKDKSIACNQHAIVTDILQNMDFQCPKCDRIFYGDYSACLKHAVTRKHGLRCKYDVERMPPCLSEHALQPVDPHSGWCDLQGTRQYIEDVHAMYYDDHFRFFGVFDGHFGSNAAKFASKHIYGLFHQLVWNQLSNSTDILLYGEKIIHLKEWLKGKERLNGLELWERQPSLLDVVNPSSINWRSVVEISAATDSLLTDAVSGTSVTVSDVMSFMFDSFLLTHNQLLYRHDKGMELSGGATATSVVFIGEHILIAHVGDSRVIACCENAQNSDDQSSAVAHIQPIQLTLDHTPYSSAEKQRVEDRGGWIDFSGSVARVNGQLAVTRSLGDPILRQYLTSSPDVLVFKYRHSSDAQAAVKNVNALTTDTQSSYCSLYQKVVYEHYSSGLMFLIIGSDGLWDVMSNYEASEFVCEHLLAFYNERKDEEDGSDQLDSFLPVDAYHEVSKLLAYEALVRGSSDNIGVNVIDLLHISSSSGGGV